MPSDRGAQFSEESGEKNKRTHPFSLPTDLFSTSLARWCAFEVAPQYRIEQQRHDYSAVVLSFRVNGMRSPAKGPFQKCTSDFKCLHMTLSCLLRISVTALRLLMPSTPLSAQLSGSLTGRICHPRPCANFAKHALQLSNT
jgi:hypothetical protein